MNITGMLIQMQRQTSYLSGRRKRERNMEIDTDKFQFVDMLVIHMFFETVCLLTHPLPT